jgi:hypothetical protein
VTGDGLRSLIDERRATEVEVAIHVLNRMLALGLPSYVRIVWPPPLVKFLHAYL